MMKNALIFLILFQALILQSACKKLIQVSPPQNSLVQDNVYTSDATAIAVLTGIYSKLSNTNPSTAGSIPSLSLYTGLSADELTLWSGNTNAQPVAYYQNTLSGAVGGAGSEFWSNIYPYIYACNSAIEGLNGSASLTPTVKQQLLGEAKFMRAYFYFYLVNLYGNVALPLTSNYKVNSSLGRSSPDLVYQQIIGDLTDAQKLLSNNYLDASLQKTTADRTRPTSWAATALLARAYLYVNNWSGADSASSVLLSNRSLFSLSSLDVAFLRSSLNNNEAIWQLQPVRSVPANTLDAQVFIIPSSGLGTAGNFGAYLSNALISSFETGDGRKTHWTGSILSGGITYYYPNKYKVNSNNASTPVTEHSMMLRLGEQYLIRAEARAHEGNINGAQADLDSIRVRAGLGLTVASTQSDLLSAAYHERQVELFTELGQRWLDLKRTGMIDAVMTAVAPQKGGSGNWNSYQQLYPVYLTDIQQDPNLTQNPGY
jgi:hypothetical protein